MEICKFCTSVCLCVYRWELQTGKLGQRGRGDIKRHVEKIEDKQRNKHTDKEEENRTNNSGGGEKIDPETVICIKLFPHKTEGTSTIKTKRCLTGVIG